MAHFCLDLMTHLGKRKKIQEWERRRKEEMYIAWSFYVAKGCSAGSAAGFPPTVSSPR